MCVCLGSVVGGVKTFHSYDTKQPVFCHGTHHIHRLRWVMTAFIYTIKCPLLGSVPITLLGLFSLLWSRQEATEEEVNFWLKKNKMKSRSGENKKWKEEMKKSGRMGSWGYPHCNVSTNQCTPVFWVQRQHCENKVAVLKVQKIRLVKLNSNISFQI